MKSYLLLPQRFRWFGVLLFIPSLVLGILWRFNELQLSFLTLSIAPKRLFSDDGFLQNEKINLTDEVAITGIIVGLLFIAFARQPREDEFIHQTRLESWQWSVLINYGLLLLATWLIHGMSFIDVMMYNMLTVLIIFILRFYWVLARAGSAQH